MEQFILFLQEGDDPGIVGVDDLGWVVDQLIDLGRSSLDEIRRGAEGDEEPGEEPGEEPVIEPVEGPVEGPVEEPVGEPVEEPVGEPVEGPVEEPSITGMAGDGLQGMRRGDLADLEHPNPFGPLFPAEGEGGVEQVSPISVAEDYAAVETEVFLGGTVWRKWTRPRKESDVCLAGTVWKKWTRVVSEPGERIVRENTTKPRSWRRTGCRRSRHKNRRLREKRRRRALRHKRRCRRGRGVNGRRQRVLFRGGANAEAGAEARAGLVLQECGRGKRNRKPRSMELPESIAHTNVAKTNYAAISAAIHVMNRHDGGDQYKIGRRRAEEFEEREREAAAVKLVREKLAQLPTQRRPVTTRDLRSVVDERMCGECDQHFDEDGDMVACDNCDGRWHRDCLESAPDDDIEETVRLPGLISSLSASIVPYLFPRQRTHIFLHPIFCSSLFGMISGAAPVVRAPVLLRKARVAVGIRGVVAATRMAETRMAETRVTGRVATAMVTVVVQSRAKLGREPAGRGTRSSSKLSMMMIRTA